MQLTKYEINGEWSNTAESDAFLQNVSLETGAVLDSIGQSYLGKEMYRLTVGSGNRILIITGGVHRREPASHEVVLMLARDLAYNTDGKYTDYLLKHKVMFIPTMNPDRDDPTRLNAHGVNINRDGYALQSLEMANLMRVIKDLDPDVFVDFHERAGTLYKVEFIDTMKLDPNATSLNRQVNNSMESFIRNELEKEGYTTDTYPQAIIGPSMTISTAGLLGCATMTPETHWQLSDKKFRVDALKSVFDKILEWHVANKSIIDNLKNDYRVNPLKAGDSFTLLNGSNEYYFNATKLEITVPEGYIIDEPSEFNLWAEVYGINVDAEGFVSTNQRSGRLIPHLLDPASDMAVVAATRVEPIEPPRRTDGRYTKVLYDEWREVFVKNYLSR